MLARSGQYGLLIAFAIYMPSHAYLIGLPNVRVWQDSISLSLPCSFQMDRYSSRIFVSILLNSPFSPFGGSVYLVPSDDLFKPCVTRRGTKSFFAFRVQPYASRADPAHQQTVWHRVARTLRTCSSMELAGSPLSDPFGCHCTLCNGIHTRCSPFLQVALKLCG